jgi:phage replication O-like protein O
MASPQIENGYTKIANELMEALTRIRIPGEAMQILLFIFRKTYGFNKKHDAISLSQFHLATGINTPNICRAIKTLIAMNIIIKKDNQHATEYRINKDYASWKPLSKKITLSKKIIEIVEKDKKSYRKRQIQKKVSKETITKETIDRFDIFWKAYPKKIGKEQARKTWKKINPSQALLEKMLEAIERGRRSKQWTQENGQFIPHPSTWLNRGGWDDEYETDGQDKSSYQSIIDGANREIARLTKLKETETDKKKLDEHEGHIRLERGKIESATKKLEGV